MRGRRDNLVGRTFGRLAVVAPAVGTHRAPHWACACACGGSVVTSARSLRSGDVRSCGCLRREHMQRVGASGVGGRTKSQTWRAA